MERNALYEHAVQVPHQVTENRENTIGTIKDKNLGGGAITYWKLHIDSGKTVSISWSG